ncbi:endonuclease/exonuclease/phosphatase family protein [Pseudomarimonas arenosa]|uniref:Endonuclease/exonuclease/phosphatase family protein n=1 Tax=Pseudomarimonas arenosa TaxID=2774145 RepID=A0AAW3ZNS3_9GAMM|nr:endonuclease/exonuclease/phosphatase family protein [Pseudomarimonas arenosa]MBD8527790.1 endonuclease/exonuclease/phosphatase family protein [Pseudomarimonas arenosa]
MPSLSMMRLALGMLALLLAPWASATEWLPRSAETSFRVLSWNVSREQFFEHTELTRRVLQVSKADIALLDEMPGDLQDRRLRQWLDADVSTRGWSFVIGRQGSGDQKAAVLSRWPLERVDEFDQIRYPEGKMAEWVAAAGSARPLRVGPTGEFPSVGALLNHQGRRVLLVSADFQCCGDTAWSWQEHRRQLEAWMLRNAVLAAWQRTQADAVVVGVDLNNVQGQQPYDLLTGRGEQRLWAVGALHRNSRHDWTWDGRGTPFKSQRMDFLFYTSRLREVRSQIFDSERFNQLEALEWGLNKQASRKMSQHRPVVADLAWQDAASDAAAE